MNKKKINILCTICARGGSKGIKNKNLTPLNKKPLIDYTISIAKKIKKIDNIVISSDSKKILKFGKKKNIKNLILRPKKYSSDNISKILAIRHALIYTEKLLNKRFDLIVDLDVTSPLRVKGDIERAIKKISSKNNYSKINLVSANESRSNPFFNAIKVEKGKVEYISKIGNKIKSRQTAPKVFDLNASVYIWGRKALLNNNNLINKNTIAYIMPFERSLDIDTSIDLKLVKYLLKK